MATEATDVDDLLREWRGFTAGDRNAILRRLPSGRRLHFQRMLAAKSVEVDGQARQALRYRGYSPWLGRLLEACENDEEHPDFLKGSTCKALRCAHEQAEETLKSKNRRISLFDVVRATVLEWTQRL